MTEGWDFCQEHNQWFRPGDTCYYCDIQAKQKVVVVEEVKVGEQRLRKVVAKFAKDQSVKCSFCGEVILNRKKAQKRCPRCTRYWQEGKRVLNIASKALHMMIVGSTVDGIEFPPESYFIRRKDGWHTYPMKGKTYLECLEAVGLQVPFDIVFGYRKCKDCGRRHELHFLARVYEKGYTDFAFWQFGKKRQRPDPIPHELLYPDYISEVKAGDPAYNPYDEQGHDIGRR